MFSYDPGMIPEYAHTISGAAGHLEGCRQGATNALVAVREEFEGNAGVNFEQAQLMINSGIDEGVQVCNRHSETVIRVLDEMMFGIGG
jgi:uncharacterized protein YukE